MIPEKHRIAPPPPFQRLLHIIAHDLKADLRDQNAARSKRRHQCLRHPRQKGYYYAQGHPFGQIAYYSTSV